MNSSFVFGRRSRTPKPQAAAAAPAAAEEDVSAETAATPMEVETSEFEAAAGVVGVVGAAQEPDTEELFSSRFCFTSETFSFILLLLVLSKIRE